MFVTVGRWDTLLESPPQGALPQVTRLPLSVRAANAYSLLKMSTMPDASSEATLLESPPNQAPPHEPTLVSVPIAAKLSRLQKALSTPSAIHIKFPILAGKFPLMSVFPASDQVNRSPASFTATKVAESEP